MTEINKIVKMLQEERYINVALLNKDGIMIESYDIWIDKDLSCYCVQELYVYNGEIEDSSNEIVNCIKYELEKRLLSLSKRGFLKVNNY